MNRVYWKTCSPSAWVLEGGGQGSRGLHLGIWNLILSYCNFCKKRCFLSFEKKSKFHHYRPLPKNLFAYLWKNSVIFPSAEKNPSDSRGLRPIRVPAGGIKRIWICHIVSLPLTRLKWAFQLITNPVCNDSKLCYYFVCRSKGIYIVTIWID